MNSLIPSISLGDTFNASPRRAPGLPVSSQKEKKKAFDKQLIFSGPCPVHLVKPGQHLISFHSRLFSGDGNQLKNRHVECHIMTKK